MRTIRISDDTYGRLQAWARPFDDSPDDVIRRLLDAVAQSNGDQSDVASQVLGKRLEGEPNRGRRDGWVQLREDLTRDLRQRTGDTQIEVKPLKGMQYSLIRSPYGVRGQSRNLAYLLKQPEREGGATRFDLHEMLVKKAGVEGDMDQLLERGRFPDSAGNPQAAWFKWVGTSEGGYNREQYGKMLDILVSVWRVCGETG